MERECEEGKDAVGVLDRWSNGLIRLFSRYTGGETVKLGLI